MYRFFFSTSQLKSGRCEVITTTDLCAPKQQQSLGETMCTLFLINVFSHYFIKENIRTRQCIKDFLEKASKHLNKDIRVLTFRNDFEASKKKTSYASQQKGSAKHTTRTIVRARQSSLLADQHERISCGSRISKKCTGFSPRSAN